MTWRARADARVQALRALPELAHLSESELRGLLGNFDEITVPAGTVIARAGRFCRQYVVVLDGRLATMDDGGCPLEKVGASCGWEAMCERGVSPATVRTASEARLLVMGRAQFRAVPMRAHEPGTGRHAPAGLGIPIVPLQDIQRMARSFTSPEADGRSAGASSGRG